MVFLQVMLGRHQLAGPRGGLALGIGAWMTIACGFDIAMMKQAGGIGVRDYKSRVDRPPGVAGLTAPQAVAQSGRLRPTIW